MITKHLRPLAAAALLALPISAMAEDAPAEDSLQTIENFGWFTAEMTQNIELNDAEKKAFIKGVESALNGGEGPADKQAAAQKVQEYLFARFNEIQEKKTDEFFKELASNPKVKQSPSGLYYEIIEEGSAGRATEADSVKLNYTGSLIDGTVFDQSQEPVTFPVSGVVKGFGEGVQLVGPGGKVKLYIPGNLGYGANPPRNSPIPPNATLIFDVDLIAINP